MNFLKNSNSLCIVTEASGPAEAAAKIAVSSETSPVETTLEVSLVVNTEPLERRLLASSLTPSV